MKKLIIEQLKEGFLFIDENDEKYAVSAGFLSRRVLVYFGLTMHGSHKERGMKNNIAPPAKVSDPKETRTQGNKTADSHSAGATLSSSSTESTQKQPARPQAEESLLKLGTPDNMGQRGQRAEILETPGFDSPAAPSILHPSDLKIPVFDYSGWSPKKYKSLSIWELPDGKVVLEYAHSRYYTSKSEVMRIPFPFPKGYFSKENGWSSSVEQAFKMYRRYLFEQEQERQVEKERQEDPDDWKYKKILKTNTRADYDGNKIEGSLEI